MGHISNAIGRPALLFLVASVGACATTTPLSQFYESTVPGLASLPAVEKAHALDSLQAQMVADAQGPRVSVRAEFSNSSGSRRVEATIRADDDAYILVGHIDADGRLRIVFPSSPKDDGFVQGGHSYLVPPFFAGFTDEYRFRRSLDYYSLANRRSRRDSYDAGTGYVFVIATWAPMHLERVTDGDRWAAYDISMDEYLSDPRAAVDELAAVVAGDDRTAYTVEYAHYTATNYGMFNSAAFSRCAYVNSGIGPTFGLGYGYFVSYPFRHGFGFGFSPFGFGYASSLYNDYDVMTGCGGYGYSSFGGGLGYPIFIGYLPVPLVPTNPGVLSPVKPRNFTPEKPHPTPTVDGPKLDDPSAPSVKRHNPIAGTRSADAATDQTAEYRRRGLIVVPDADVPLKPRPRGSPNETWTAGRPTLDQMVQRHLETANEYPRAGTSGPHGVSPQFVNPGSSAPHPSAPQGGGYSAPRTPSQPSHVEPMRSPPATSHSSGGSSGGGGHTTSHKS